MHLNFVVETKMILSFYLGAQNFLTLKEENKRKKNQFSRPLY